MADRRRRYPLTAKLIAVVCAAAAMAALTYFCMGTLGNRLVNRYFLSPEVVQTRLSQEIRSLRDFVAENHTTSTDLNAIGAWNREHPRVRLTVAGSGTTVQSDANGAELVGNEYGLVMHAESRIASAEYPVNFRDGVYSVVVFDRSRGAYETTVSWAALLGATLVFLIVLVIYDRLVTRSVVSLSRQVRTVSRGNLDMQIRSDSSDEIGELARDVDAMRLSIIDKLQREETAWQANSQLITAISHDVRTPLTALMGYLDILSDDTISPEERSAYLEICKNNARRLKSLTDELFGFFLVFGGRDPDQKLEDLDAATLLNQIFFEYQFSLEQQGFRVNTVHSGAVTGEIRVDLGHLRRVFDNLFSNIGKYADPDEPVGILVENDSDQIGITISNAICVRENPVESNRIGLKTCEKLMQAMGGSCTQQKNGSRFLVELVLPRPKT